TGSTWAAGRRVPPVLRRNDLHRQLTSLAETHGPIYTIQGLNRSLVVVSSPDLAKEVLRVNESIFSTRPIPIVGRILTYGGIDLANLSYGPDWVGLRKVIFREVLSSGPLDVTRWAGERLRRGAGDSRRRGDGDVRCGDEGGGRFDPGHVVGRRREGGGAPPNFAVEYREATREMTELLERANVRRSKQSSKFFSVYNSNPSSVSFSPYGYFPNLSTHR
ncbi:unnamed protein product, partial [Linum tenue]